VSGPLPPAPACQFYAVRSPISVSVAVARRSIHSEETDCVAVTGPRVLATGNRNMKTAASRANQWIVCGALLLACGAWSVPHAAADDVHATRVIEVGLDDARRPTVVTGVALSPDGRTIAAACDDHQVRVWDAATGQLRAHLDGHADWVRAVAFSPDGQRLASGAKDHTVKLWDIASGMPVFESPDLASAVAALSFHPNGQQVAAVGFCNSLAIINTSSGEVTQRLECTSKDVRAVAFSRDGARMATAGRDGNVRIWNIASGELERDIIAGQQRIRALAFSPDGARLAAAGDGVMIHLVDLTGSGQNVTLTARPAKVFALVFLDDQTLATAGSNNRIAIWDLPTRSTTRQLTGHTGTVASLACDATGTLLVSGGYDTTVRVWNLAEHNDLQPSVARTPSDTTR
jgi:WD40 repeat protein